MCLHTVQNASRDFFFDTEKKLDGSRLWAELYTIGDYAHNCIRIIWPRPTFLPPLYE